MSEYALTAAQHTALGKLLNSGVLNRGGQQVQTAKPVLPGAVRVMCVDRPSFYRPKQPRRCVIFEPRSDVVTVAVMFTGSKLVGDVLLTIDGNEYVIPCDANTAELRAHVGDDQNRNLRATALPGYWEFAFEDIPKPPIVTAVPDDYFTGGLFVVSEGWRTIPAGDSVEMIDVADVLPFMDGEIRIGAMAVAVWNDLVGYVSTGWHCRPFSFAAPLFEPVVDPGGGIDEPVVDPGGGGGGGFDPDPPGGPGEPG